MNISMVIERGDCNRAKNVSAGDEHRIPAQIVSKSTVVTIR